ncbi:MAG: hypothetical protein IJC55_00675, partial [Clostridia bacterium]|nr:hypothetical protein [Clostridia bacterium]
MTKKILAIVIAVALCVTMLLVAIPSSAELVAGAETEKVYLLGAKDDNELYNSYNAAIGSNKPWTPGLTGSLNKATPYNTYADSESGARGGYVDSQVTNTGDHVIVSACYKGGLDLTKTDGKIAVWVYVQKGGGTRSLLFQFISGVGDQADGGEGGFGVKAADAALAAFWDKTVNTGDLQDGWNKVEINMADGTNVDWSNLTNFRVLSRGGAATAVAIGAIYSVRTKATASIKDVTVIGTTAADVGTFASAWAILNGNGGKNTAESLVEKTSGNTTYKAWMKANASGTADPYVQRFYGTNPVDISDAKYLEVKIWVQKSATAAADGNVTMFFNSTDSQQLDWRDAVMDNTNIVNVPFASLQNGWNVVKVYPTVYKGDVTDGYGFDAVFGARHNRAQQFNPAKLYNINIRSDVMTNVTEVGIGDIIAKVETLT